MPPPSLSTWTVPQSRLIRKPSTIQGRLLSCQARRARDASPAAAEVDLLDRKDMGDGTDEPTAGELARAYR